MELDANNDILTFIQVQKHFNHTLFLGVVQNLKFEQKIEMNRLNLSQIIDCKQVLI